MYSLTFCVRVMSPERHHWKQETTTICRGLSLPRKFLITLAGSHCSIWSTMEIQQLDSQAMQLHPCTHAGWKTPGKIPNVHTFATLSFSSTTQTVKHITCHT